MASLTPIADFSGLITNEEICRTLSRSEQALAEGALNLGYNELYQLTINNCSPTNARALHCLHLYMYALKSYPTNGESDSTFLTEVQLSAILTLIEQTSKTCCCE